jgi:hypothetical protein
MIVDPWGAVIAQCSEGAGFALAQVIYFVTEIDEHFHSSHI